MLLDLLQVKKAIDYAKEAHKGQMRRTGEPYITHCIHTALILAALVPAEGSRVSQLSGYLFPASIVFLGTFLFLGEVCIFPILIRVLIRGVVGSSGTPGSSMNMPNQR